jgi:hypothetical protein
MVINPPPTMPYRRGFIRRFPKVEEMTALMLAATGSENKKRDAVRVAGGWSTHWHLTPGVLDLGQIADRKTIKINNLRLVVRLCEKKHEFSRQPVDTPN